MFIKLDLETDQPIYMQLVEQIISGIAKEELLPGERLPSVRSLAADIGINMHTVNKAYQELRQRGFILIHRQRGVVVNPEGAPAADEDYIQELKDSLNPLIAESLCRKLSKEEFLKLCEELYQPYEKRRK